jgi:serine/threonine protein kinase/class 3 adenylate cyclase
MTSDILAGAWPSFVNMDDPLSELALSSPSPAAPQSPRLTKKAEASGSARLDRFEMSRLLGSGPDGVAYRGIDKHTGRSVEIRLLAAARRTPGRMENIAARLRLLGLLNHPGSLRLIVNACGQSPSFVAIDAASGQTLDARRATGVLSQQSAFQVAEQLCSCLAAAHQIGLHHGTLEPAAVFLDEQLDPQIDLTDLRTSSENENSRTFLAPEVAGGQEPDAAADIYSLAKLIVWMFLGDARTDHAQLRFDGTGRHGAAMHQLLGRAASADPVERPTALEFHQILRQLLSSPAEIAPPGAAASVPCDKTGEIAVHVNLPKADCGTTDELNAKLVAGDAAPTSLSPRRLAEGDLLGRYQLLSKLGEGGMGAVFKAQDQATGRFVAIKVLKAATAANASSLRRFQKEARLLAAVNNPYVTNLIEVNEEDGLHYMALEFVEGTDLKKKLVDQGPFEEAEVLAIAADVARALVDAHQRGIVHRDIKPENILVPAGAAAAPYLSIKLSDFGIARSVDQSESLAVTQAGSLIGTPFYMSPEQCKGGGEIGPQSDIYALGVTMFELLSGRLPFMADDPLKLAAMHCFEAPPALATVNGLISDRTIAVVEKSLAKRPDERFADAGQLLRELDGLLRGEPASVALHPVLPDAAAGQLVEAEFVYDLKSPPEQLWPFVANTDRFNRAIGLPPAEFTNREMPGRGLVRMAKVKYGPVSMEWVENPFEWIEGRRMCVLREFQSGPFKTFANIVELKRRADGGTRLSHIVKFLPRNAVGRFMAGIETRWRTRKALDRVYHRIDETLRDEQAAARNVDPFEPAAKLSFARQARLADRADQLVKRGVASELAHRLGEFVAAASPQEVVRIRPVELADRLQREQEEVLVACLHAVAAGILKLQWDILCPTCRIASDTQATLREIAKHSFCEACNLDFELDLANSVELIFRAHPDLRDAATGTYCVGGPGHSPHVVAQIRLAAGERMEVDLALSLGQYILRSPQMAQTVPVCVQPSGAPSHCELFLSRVAGSKTTLALRAGSQLVTIENDLAQPLVLRLERTIPRSNVITAAQASATSLFRELFPEETLGSGRLISAEQVTLLVTNIDGIDALYEQAGDASAFALVQSVTEAIGRQVRLGRGAVVKFVGESVVAAFEDPAHAVETALNIHLGLESEAETARVRVNAAIHRGPALVTTINDRLDYFGSTARVASALAQRAAGGVVLLSQDVVTDPGVAQLLGQRQILPEWQRLDLPGRPQELIQIIYLA